MLFKDCETSTQTVNPQLEYDAVSSSTGDFGENQNQTHSNCNHSNENVTGHNHNDNTGSHNYSYQNSFQYHQKYDRRCPFA